MWKRFLLTLILTIRVTAQDPEERRIAAQGGELVYFFGAAEKTGKAPLLVALHPQVSGPLEKAREHWKFWQPFCRQRGWMLLVPWTGNGTGGSTDQGVKALELIIADAKTRMPVEESRIYLTGFSDAAAGVFYAASRWADLWAAAAALQGSPVNAINSNCLFGANTVNVPVLWTVGGKDELYPPSLMEPLRGKLETASYNLEWRLDPDLTREGPLEAAKLDALLDWLAGHQKEPFPMEVDCETGNPAFAHCYWIEMTKFNPARRNDVLLTSRVPPGSGAALAFGPFGYNPAGTGPGVEVVWLPEKYSGPLRLRDRIVSIAGSAIAGPQEYVKYMDAVREEKTVAVMLGRGTARMRIETKIILPQRAENVTARVQGHYLLDQKEIQIVSRAVTELRLAVPPHWIPAKLTWNGSELGQADTPGCWLLNWAADPPTAKKCN